MNGLIYALPWILVSLVTVFWYVRVLGREIVGRTSGRMSAHWFLMLLILTLYLIAAGRLGGDLGLPSLFRDDPATGFDWNSRALWGAMAITYLVGLVWIVVYFFLFLDSRNFDDLPRSEVETVPSSGGVAVMESVQSRSLLQRWAAPSQADPPFRSMRMTVGFLAVNTVPFLLLLFVIGLFPYEVEDGGTCSSRSMLVEAWEYGLGIFLGLAMLFVVLLLTRLVARLAARSKSLQSIFRWTSRLSRDEHLRAHPDPELSLDISAGYWAFLLINTILIVIVFSYHVIVPSMGTGAIFCCVTLGYLILMSARKSLQLPLILLVVLWVAYSNSSPYKYRFPGIMKSATESYYAAPVSDGVPQLGGPLLLDTDVLPAWKAQLADDKPKIVLVAVSGGGYRASFWTATVLDQLQALDKKGDLKGIIDRIRIMTGASGGMVGAAYFTASRIPRNQNTSVVELLTRNTRQPSPAGKLTSPDSLTPLVKQLVQRDIPMIFCPISEQRVDRGTVFEEQWKSLNLTFASLSPLEAKGAIPSLIISPMIIETGERLLISNLNLAGVARPATHTPGPTIKTRNQYTQSAIEFFQTFPAAHSSFQLKTAVRMSASFPWVLPAVSLPTTKSKRIVDAGYYDNYGINLAAAWAYENRVWIKAETSGIVLIQILAYPREAGPSPQGVETPGDRLARAVGQSLQWLTSPVEGALSARELSMLYRNEEQLRLLDDAFNEGRLKADRFNSFTFANFGNAALNVLITPCEIDEMNAAFDEKRAKTDSEKIAFKRNSDQMRQLIDAWNATPDETPRPRTAPLLPAR